MLRMGFSGGRLSRLVFIFLLSFCVFSFNLNTSIQAKPKETTEKTSSKASVGEQVKALCSKLVSVLPKKKKLTTEEYEAMKKSGPTATRAIQPAKATSSKSDKPIDQKKEAVLIAALKDFQSATNKIQAILSSGNSTLTNEVLAQLFNNLKILAADGAKLGTEANKLIFSSLMRYYTSNPAFILALQKAVKSKTINSRQVARFDNSILDFVRAAFPDYESSLSPVSPEYQLINALRSGSPHLGIKLKIDHSWKLSISLWMKDQAAKAFALDRQLRKQRSEGKIDKEALTEKRQKIRDDYWYIASWQTKQNHYRRLSSQLREAWGSIRSINLEEISSLSAINRGLQESASQPAENTVEVAENIFGDGSPVFDDGDFDTGNNASDTNPGLSDLGDNVGQELEDSEVVEVDRSGEHLALDDSGDIPIEGNGDTSSQIKFTQTAIGSTRPVQSNPAEDDSTTSTEKSGDSSVGGFKLIDDD